jgi:hypothetical protein
MDAVPALGEHTERSPRELGYAEATSLRSGASAV